MYSVLRTCISYGTRFIPFLIPVLLCLVTPKLNTLGNTPTTLTDTSAVQTLLTREKTKLQEEKVTIGGSMTLEDIRALGCSRNPPYTLFYTASLILHWILSLELQTEVVKSIFSSSHFVYHFFLFATIFQFDISLLSKTYFL